MTESKSAIAMKILAAQPERSVYSVAKQVGISPTTLYTKIARAKTQEGRERCKCCGQLLPAK